VFLQGRLVSERKDIIDGSEAFYAKAGLVYSEILGWIDLGHARGEDAKKTLQLMKSGERSQKDYYPVVYSQSMYLSSRKRFGVGKHARWLIKRGRPIDQRHSIVLAMMMHTAVSFERMQSSLPFNWISDSGFSAEDLVSDLLGFYRVVRPMNYFPWLQLISKREAIKRWDHYGPVGNYKNKLFKPLLYPDPEKNNHVQPVYGVLPKFMMSVKPFCDFRNDTIKIIVNNGTHANFFMRQKYEFE
jgi:hypothetical protein